jgi:hypothetical protein
VTFIAFAAVAGPFVGAASAALARTALGALAGFSAAAAPTTGFAAAAAGSAAPGAAVSPAGRSAASPAARLFAGAAFTAPFPSAPFAAADVLAAEAVAADAFVADVLVVDDLVAEVLAADVLDPDDFAADDFAADALDPDDFAADGFAGATSSGAEACLGAGFGVALRAGAAFVALAVVALEAGVAERAAATFCVVVAEPSTTTATPASASARRIFLAWAGVTAANSTLRATSADVICPPARSARAISDSVSERTSAPVWRAAVTNDLPEAMSGAGWPGQAHGEATFRAGVVCLGAPTSRTGRGRWFAACGQA